MVKNVNYVSSINHQQQYKMLHKQVILRSLENKVREKELLFMSMEFSCCVNSNSVVII